MDNKSWQLKSPEVSGDVGKLGIFSPAWQVRGTPKKKLANMKWTTTIVKVSIEIGTDVQSSDVELPLLVNTVAIDAGTELLFYEPAIDAEKDGENEESDHKGKGKQKGKGSGKGKGGKSEKRGVVGPNASAPKKGRKA